MRRHQHATMVALSIAVATALTAQSINAAIEYETEVDFGAIDAQSPVSATIVVSNHLPSDVDLIFLPTCSCVSVGLRRLSVPSGNEAIQTVTLDPSGYDGTVVRVIQVRTPNGELPLDPITLRAQVVSGSRGVPCPTCNDVPSDLADANNEETGAADDDESAQAGGILRIDLYLDRGCATCYQFLSHRVPQIRSAAAHPFMIVERDILDSSQMASLLDVLERLDTGLESLPVAVVGSQVFQGIPAIDAGISAAVSADGTPTSGLAENGVPSGTSATGGEIGGAARSTVYSLSSVVIAGLADGINPCAFSTIIFLIAMLGSAGRSRREILVIGLIYIGVVFAGYLAVGLGLFASVRALLVFPKITRIFQYVLAAVLLALAILSARDAWLASAGRTRDMSLQLSTKMKQRIHSAIRSHVRGASLVVGTVVLGLAVTVFEFSCTGQVYLPVIMHLARTERRAFWLLVAYNVAFILPLVGVFSAAYLGIAIERIAAFLSRHVAATKIGLALVFVLLAVLTIAI